MLHKTHKISINSPILISSILSMALSAPVMSADIDFSGLPAGTIVNELTSGSGISGDLSGKVIVWGDNPAFAFDVNTAVIFDTANPTGGDTDLGTPNKDFAGPGIGAGGQAGSPYENNTALGNVLIIEENMIDANMDNLIDDPDDANEKNMSLYMDFSKTKKNGKGTVTVNSVTYMDVETEQGEGGAYVEFSGPNIATSLLGLPPTGNNGVHTIDGIGLEGVDNVRVVFNGSAALASVAVEQDAPRNCWITTGGFQNSGIQSGSKDYTFGGNVGPQPSGSWEVIDHNTGDNFHSNEVHIVNCETINMTGPGQPGGKKGFDINKAYFAGTGRLNGIHGYPFEGFVIDAGEPQGKNGNDNDYFEIVVHDPVTNAIVFEATGNLDGGNVQIHPSK